MYAAFYRKRLYWLRFHIDVCGSRHSRIFDARRISVSHELSKEVDALPPNRANIFWSRAILTNTSNAST